MSEVMNVREVVVPIDQHGRELRIDPDKNRDPQRVMRTLSKWLSRWATRNGKWLINEPRLKRWEDITTLEVRYGLKWASCDAPEDTAGWMWTVPEAERTITYRRLEE